MTLPSNETLLIAYAVSLVLCFIFAKWKFNHCACFWFGTIPVLQQIALIVCAYAMWCDHIAPFLGVNFRKFNDWFEK